MLPMIKAIRSIVDGQNLPDIIRLLKTAAAGRRPGRSPAARAARRGRLERAKDPQRIQDRAPRGCDRRRHSETALRFLFPHAKNERTNPDPEQSDYLAEFGAAPVAEWAGHSVHVLLKVYAKCIDGLDEAARRRIAEALEVEEDAA